MWCTQKFIWVHLRFSLSKKVRLRYFILNDTNSYQCIGKSFLYQFGIPQWWQKYFYIGYFLLLFEPCCKSSYKYFVLTLLFISWKWLVFMVMQNTCFWTYNHHWLAAIILDTYERFARHFKSIILQALLYRSFTMFIICCMEREYE